MKKISENIFYYYQQFSKNIFFFSKKIINNLYPQFIYKFKNKINHFIITK